MKDEFTVLCEHTLSAHTPGCLVTPEPPQMLERGISASELLKHPSIFRFGDVSQARDGFVASGFAELDQALQGGWPVARLTELLCDHVGIGELSLLLPVLPKRAVADSISSVTTKTKRPSKSAQPTPRRALFISQIALPTGMPCIAYAPTLERFGIDLKVLAFVTTSSAQQTLWALEQALLSGATRTVFAWIGEHPHDFALRRISQAARKSQSLCFLMRPRAAQTCSSPAELRIAVSPAMNAASIGMMDLKLLKRPGLLRETTLQLDPRALPCLAADRAPAALLNLPGNVAASPRSPLIESALLSPLTAPLAAQPKIRERSFIVER